MFEKYLAFALENRIKTVYKDLYLKQICLTMKPYIFGHHAKNR